MTDAQDPRLSKALCRYQVISAYLADNPRRGQKRPLLNKLASKIWAGPDGDPLVVAADTLRVWVRRYRQHGLEGLMDKPRPQRGISALSPEQIDFVCRLKKEVPERSVDRVISVAEALRKVEPGVLKRSTVHRVLQRNGLSARRPTPERQDLDRFEADHPNHLWQSDMLVGPWLPDPQQPGRVRRACLFAFLDDHSRLLLHGRFGFRENLPHLELVFRRALQRWGVPRRVYYDNGQVYRSNHMKLVVAELGIHRIIFTRAYRPMGHGKIEALNRLVRSAFLAELQAAPQITTLDALNEAFSAWADLEYNRSIHSEIGQTPLQRWRSAIDRVAYADEEKLHQAFLWREQRTTDKAGVFSLLGTRYQVGAELAKRRIELRFDPEATFQIEVWCRGEFVQRVRPLDIQAHRRPAPSPAAADTTPSVVVSTPTCNWLGHLVDKHRAERQPDPTPRQLAEAAKARRLVADKAICELLAEHLAPEVVDEAAIAAYLDRYGPFDLEIASQTLARLLDARTGRDQHVTVYLDAIRKELGR